MHRFPTTAVTIAFSLAALTSSTGCSTPGLPTGASPAPADCTAVSDLFMVDEVLADPDHACHDWLDRVHGRVARSSSASAAVWTLRGDHGTAIMTSAVHTLGVGFLGVGDADVPETVRNPADETGVARIRLIAASGRAVDDRLSPMFVLYNPAIPADQNDDGFRDITPEHDFYLAVLDSQKLDPGPPLGTPEPLTNQPPSIYDPAGDTLADPTHADVEPGQIVLILGFPSHPRFAGGMTAGVGVVLSDDEAGAAVEALGNAGDEEGGIPYDADVEMFIEGSAAGGMSGGGVFDVDGHLVAITVRATEAVDLPRYVRAVRMTYVVTELGDAFGRLDTAMQDAVQPFLERIMQNVE